MTVKVYVNCRGYTDLWIIINEQLVKKNMSDVRKKLDK